MVNITDNIKKKEKEKLRKMPSNCSLEKTPVTKHSKSEEKNGTMCVSSANKKTLLGTGGIRSKCECINISPFFNKHNFQIYCCYTNNCYKRGNPILYRIIY